jgi:DNA-binding XRE family transcriptional regulator
MRSAVRLHKRFPSGIIAMVKVDSAGQIGQLVRRRRKEAGMTLKDAAAMAGVGVRFLSELERGKPTLQLGLAISVLQLFGLELHVEQRGDQRG